MLQYDLDDLPTCSSWWPEAAEVIARNKRDQRDRKLDGKYLRQDRERAKRYYNANRETINEARREQYKQNKQALKYYYAHAEEILARRKAARQARSSAGQPAS